MRESVHKTTDLSSPVVERPKYDPLREMRESMQKTTDLPINTKQITLRRDRKIEVKPSSPVASPLKIELKSVPVIQTNVKPEVKPTSPVLEVKPVVQKKKEAPPVAIPVVETPVEKPVPIIKSLPKPISPKRDTPPVSLPEDDQAKKKAKSEDFQRKLQPLRDIITELSNLNRDFEEFCKDN
jgi:hypothetical protein